MLVILLDFGEETSASLIYFFETNFYFSMLVNTAQMFAFCHFRKLHSVRLLSLRCCANVCLFLAWLKLTGFTMIVMSFLCISC